MQLHIHVCQKNKERRETKCNEKIIIQSILLRNNELRLGCVWLQLDRASCRRIHPPQGPRQKVALSGDVFHCLFRCHFLMISSEHLEICQCMNLKYLEELVKIDNLLSLTHSPTVHLSGSNTLQNLESANRLRSMLPPTDLSAMRPKANG